MNYIDITSPDINNGLGCRATLWISGCPHQCPGCHNPESWDYNFGKHLTYDTINEIVEILKKPYIKGLTLSGGDPLGRCENDLAELYEYLKDLKSRIPDDKDIWIYSGDVYENLLKNPTKRNILKLCDVLVDGPYIHNRRNITLPFRGSDNQRIIDLKHTKGTNIKIIEIE